MTLLSIREQEAVKSLASTIKTWTFEHTDTLSSEDAVWDLIEARDKALILATRDAIARQVRELAEKELYAAGEEAVLHAATLIEGLPCE